MTCERLDSQCGCCVIIKDALRKTTSWQKLSHFTFFKISNSIQEISHPVWVTLASSLPASKDILASLTSAIVPVERNMALNAATTDKDKCSLACYRTGISVTSLGLRRGKC